MRVSILDFLIGLDLVGAIILTSLNIISPLGAAVYAFITSVLLIWSVIKGDKGRITYTSALLFYTMAIQFGFALPYLFFGRETFHSYTDYTLRFMQSPYLSKAIMLGVIAVASMREGVLFSRRNSIFLEDITREYGTDEKTSNRLYVASIVLLLAVLVFFAYNILTGGMRLVSTYEVFRQSSAYNSSIYSYILILFYVGTIYLASAGTVKTHKLGWGIWLLLVLLFALNGNKGEFMYAMLAVVGMKGIEGQKITGKMLLMFALVLFLIIPGITSLRNIGIIGNLRNAQLDVFDAFGEMGMQIRTSVYVLQDIGDGKYGYLWGRSYWQPIFNIITPFLSHTQATAVIREMYPGHGFSQIIESYLNFHIIGVFAFFFIIGLLFGREEIRVRNKNQLAYFGTIVCIFINATRNYFAFVPGQIIIVSLLYLVITKTKVSHRAV